MLNAASLKAVQSAKFSQRFVRPRYDSYCFSNFPATIEFLLTGQNNHTLPQDVFGNLPTHYKNVIFFFIDAFGWRFYERYADRYNILKTISNQGSVSKLTSQFPSTTAAHVTCMHTGLDVGQSGVYEWNYYEPLVDEIISPLLFSYAGDKSQYDTVRRASIAPERFFPNQTFYQRLKRHGIHSHILQYQAYARSTYSDIVFQGANVHPYRALDDPLQQLTHLLTIPNSPPSYYFLYIDSLDAVCHNYGPTSRNLDLTVEDCFTLIERSFYQNVHNKVRDTLFMISADHGQIEVRPRYTYYLNQEIPGIAQYFKTNHRGQPLVPAGSARDMFLHVQEQHIDTLIHELRQRLNGRAEIYRTEDLIKQHFFGMNDPSPTFRQRVGNVVILPYKNETVWWYQEGRFGMHFQAHHGGLTPEEMEIPLLLLPL